MFRENISLSPFNTFGIDAVATYFTSFGSVEELGEILNSKLQASNSKLVLGGGSNILLTKDFDGLVLKNEIEGIEMTREDDENVYLKIQLSDILKNDFDKQLLEKLENFQSSFLNEDDLINVLRNDVAELDKLLVWEALEEKNMMRDIENNMESIRRNIDHAEKQFTRIKSEFINYVSENI